MKSSLVFIGLVVGFLIFVRLTADLRTNRLLTEQNLVQLVGFYVLYSLICVILMPTSTLLFGILLFLPLFLVIFLSRYLSRHNKREFKEKIIPVLDQVILHMSCGHSFRSAMSAAVKGLNDFSRTKFERLMDGLQIDQKPGANDAHDPIVAELLKEFKKIETESHMSTVRILQLRNRFKKEKEIANKKARALGPVKAQVIVLSILYFMALIFACSRPQAGRFVFMVGVSLLLFVTGVGISIYFARSFKWKV